MKNLARKVPHDKISKAMDLTNTIKKLPLYPKIGWTC